MSYRRNKKAAEKAMCFVKQSRYAHKKGIKYFRKRHGAFGASFIVFMANYFYKNNVMIDPKIYRREIKWEEQKCPIL